MWWNSHLVGSHLYKSWWFVVRKLSQTSSFKKKYLILSFKSVLKSFLNIWHISRKMQIKHFSGQQELKQHSKGCNTSLRNNIEKIIDLGFLWFFFSNSTITNHNSTTSLHGSLTFPKCCFPMPAELRSGHPTSSHHLFYSPLPLFSFLTIFSTSVFYVPS